MNEYVKILHREYIDANNSKISVSQFSSCLTILLLNIFYFLVTLALFSHFWLATVQEVLQADWQDAWHSPQPALLSDFL